MEAEVERTDDDERPQPIWLNRRPASRVAFVAPCSVTDLIAHNEPDKSDMEMLAEPPVRGLLADSSHQVGDKPRPHTIETLSGPLPNDETLATEQETEIIDSPPIPSEEPRAVLDHDSEQTENVPEVLRQLADTIVDTAPNLSEAIAYLINHEQYHAAETLSEPDKLLFMRIAAAQPLYRAHHALILQLLSVPGNDLGNALRRNVLRVLGETILNAGILPMTIDIVPVHILHALRADNESAGIAAIGRNHVRFNDLQILEYVKATTLTFQSFAELDPIVARARIFMPSDALNAKLRVWKTLI
jgi:hypothetical protein